MTDSHSGPGVLTRRSFLQGMLLLGLVHLGARLPALGSATDSLLVLAPHPDDEVLSSAGLIQHVLARKGQVHVVLLTSGDGFRADAVRVEHVLKPLPADMLRLGRMRMGESFRGITSLGVPAENIHFLGMPDGGTIELLTYFWSHPFTSPYTGVDRVPYRRAWRPDAPYTGEEAFGEIRDLIVRIRPTLMTIPHPYDRHPDHAAAYAYATLALAQLAASGVDPRVLTYLVHWPGFPQPDGYFPRLALTPPANMPAVAGPFQPMPLTESVEMNDRRALLHYKTQLAIMRDILMSFIRRNALFAPPVVRPLPVGPLATLAIEGVAAISPGLALDSVMASRVDDLLQVEAVFAVAVPDRALVTLWAWPVGQPTVAPTGYAYWGPGLSGSRKDPRIVAQGRRITFRLPGPIPDQVLVMLEVDSGGHFLYRSPLALMRTAESRRS